MASENNAKQMPVELAAGGPRTDGSPRPTLLTSHFHELGHAKDAGTPTSEGEPKPQVFGVTLGQNDDDDDDVTDPNSELLPSNRKLPEELLKEEAFWSKAQEALQERAQREQLLQFLRKHRFKDVNSSSGWFFNFRFPLHAAVEDNDAQMVSLLLQFKSKTKLKDAAGLSARQLARKKNSNGSHDAVLQILNDHAAARRKRAAARRAARVAKAKTEGAEEDAIDAEVKEQTPVKPDVGGSPEGI
mmetsp:Transcript_39244/g.70225  ORF Transcript_39244/g.70225 Transcript_39244/m.70225 type:complete len:244 (+) Transcript_39244:54-785(+)